MNYNKLRKMSKETLVNVIMLQNSAIEPLWVIGYALKRGTMPKLTEVGDALRELNTKLTDLHEEVDTAHKDMK